ncbi:Protein root UVB sensitive 6, partial [Camellia lanceoleosa]
NVGAVTSTSTRTPIYKAFAKGENIGDVTAKGEYVGNIADLVKSVVLRTLNRARESSNTGGGKYDGKNIQFSLVKREACCSWYEKSGHLIGSEYVLHAYGPIYVLCAEVVTSLAIARNNRLIMLAWYSDVFGTD